MYWSCSYYLRPAKTIYIDNIDTQGDPIRARSTYSMVEYSRQENESILPISFLGPAAPGRAAADPVRAGDAAGVRLLPRHEPRPLHPPQRGGRAAHRQHLPPLPATRPAAAGKSSNVLSRFRRFGNLRGLPDMMSATFLDFLTLSPLSAFGSDLYY